MLNPTRSPTSSLEAEGRQTLFGDARHARFALGLTRREDIRTEPRVTTEGVFGDDKGAACFLSTGIPTEAPEYHRDRLPWTGVYGVQGRR